MINLLQKLNTTHSLELFEYERLIKGFTPKLMSVAADMAQKANIYGNEIYIRGLIEFTNYCKNDCLYCGIRHSNHNVSRYRLTNEQILSCCKSGYELGFRTFVLQGGEDPYYTDERICELVSKIKKLYPDCAITLSIGEKSKESYQKFFDAGADRYLLRHETANEDHYKSLHPKEMSLVSRKQCLFDLKEIGYQVGCGFMVGSPNQTIKTLYEDLKFIKELNKYPTLPFNLFNSPLTNLFANSFSLSLANCGLSSFKIFSQSIIFYL